MITLTTDFGTRDPFVGQMKGVIAMINEEARVVDITHGIRQFNVLEGALVLEESYHYFPEGTVHVAVVDPGVGSARRPIIIKAGGHLFVGPDNGLFTGIMNAAGKYEAFHITERRFMLKNQGATFHGRDVFAPVAAHLFGGKDPQEMGPRIADPMMLPLPRPKADELKIEGEIIYIDSFGNCITNIRGQDMARLKGEMAVSVGGQTVGVMACYEQGQCAAPGALINSGGRLEIFVNMASAERLLNLKTGHGVTVALKQDRAR